MDMYAMYLIIKGSRFLQLQFGKIWHFLGKEWQWQQIKLKILAEYAKGFHRIWIAIHSKQFKWDNVEAGTSIIPLHLNHLEYIYCELIALF